MNSKENRLAVSMYFISLLITGIVWKIYGVEQWNALDRSFLGLFVSLLIWKGYRLLRAYTKLI